MLQWVKNNGVGNTEIKKSGNRKLLTVERDNNQSYHGSFVVESFVSSPGGD